MDEKISKRVDQYMELLEDLKERSGSELTALNLLQEISKDRRMDEIRQERGTNGRDPVTEKQRNFMKKLKLKCPKNLTKQEASIIIDEELARIAE